MKPKRTVCKKCDVKKKGIKVRRVEYHSGGKVSIHWRRTDGDPYGRFLCEEHP